MLKVLGISFSPRKRGNTEILVKQALSGSRQEGAEIEFASISGKQIRPCDECLSCVKSGTCHTKDDMQQFYSKMLEAKGIILGTPVFCWSITGQGKVFLDRTYSLTNPSLKLANKVGGAVAVATRRGAQNALDLFQTYFQYNHMLAADSVVGLAQGKGDIIKDQVAMKMAFEMGRQVTLLAKSRFEYPTQFDMPIRRYVTKKHRTPLYPLP